MNVYPFSHLPPSLTCTKMHVRTCTYVYTATRDKSPKLKVPFTLKTHVFFITHKSLILGEHACRAITYVTPATGDSYNVHTCTCVRRTNNLVKTDKTSMHACMHGDQKPPNFWSNVLKLIVFFFNCRTHTGFETLPKTSGNLCKCMYVHMYKVKNVHVRTYVCMHALMNVLYLAYCNYTCYTCMPTCMDTRTCT